MPTIRCTRTPEADPAIPLPAYETAGAAGADLRANFPEAQREGVVVDPGARVLVPTGLKLAIPEGHEIQIRPRSGLALKNGITLPNSPGTIDSDYRGPLGVIVMNLGDAPVLRARFDLVDSLDETARGQGGFGSTGRS